MGIVRGDTSALTYRMRGRLKVVRREQMPTRLRWGDCSERLIFTYIHQAPRGRPQTYAEGAMHALRRRMKRGTDRRSSAKGKTTCIASCMRTHSWNQGSSPNRVGLSHCFYCSVYQKQSKHVGEFTETLPCAGQLVVDLPVHTKTPKTPSLCSLVTRGTNLDSPFPQTEADKDRTQYSSSSTPLPRVGTPAPLTLWPQIVNVIIEVLRLNDVSPRLAGVSVYVVDRVLVKGVVVLASQDVGESGGVRQSKDAPPVHLSVHHHEYGHRELTRACAEASRQWQCSQAS